MATVNSAIARQQISELAPSDVEAIKHLKQAIAQGKHWYLALLEAVKVWDSIEEDYDDNITDTSSLMKLLIGYSLLKDYVRRLASSFHIKSELISCSSISNR